MFTACEPLPGFFDSISILFLENFLIKPKQINQSIMFTDIIQRLSSTTTTLLLPSTRSIHLSIISYASPLRKKKIVNPLTTRKQFERKVRRLEREINRLESIPLKLKPILEQQLPPNVVRELNERKRTITNDERNQLDKMHVYLNKILSIYRGIETREEMRLIKLAVDSQQKALNILQRDYPELYSEAIQIDHNLIPYQINNVKKHTTPNPSSYKCPDGRQQDITKEWRL
ncbi:mitochondrial ribosomal protein L40 [Dermatophagoides pteronyssinus]|uniref:mitochondrial ribosomal protein L40 n=1 Tax=Dermatophagoides pteronyssinus TaxID=6956 RepID=UPI003F6767C3